MTKAKKKAAPKAASRKRKKRRKAAPRRKPKRADKITERELLVLRGIVEGLTDAKIGERLGVSYETVKTYVNRIRTKLGVRTKTEIAVLVVTKGLLTAA